MRSFFFKFLQQFFPRKEISGQDIDSTIAPQTDEKEWIDPLGLSIMVALGLGTLWLSNNLADLAQSVWGVSIPSILITA